MNHENLPDLITLLFCWMGRVREQQILFFKIENSKAQASTFHASTQHTSLSLLMKEIKSLPVNSKPESFKGHGHCGWATQSSASADLNKFRDCLLQ